jgi:chromosomal replication initiation ATPase DnaA
MKSEIFNKYVDKVCSLFGVSKDDFFKKKKSRELADSRFLVYYLCSQRNIDIVYIQKFMNENGYKTPHSTIVHGISVASGRADSDPDYAEAVSYISRSVRFQ